MEGRGEAEARGEVGRGWAVGRREIVILAEEVRPVRGAASAAAATAAAASASLSCVALAAANGLAALELAVLVLAA